MRSTAECQQPRNPPLSCRTTADFIYRYMAKTHEMVTQVTRHAARVQSSAVTSDPEAMGNKSSRASVCCVMHLRKRKWMHLVRICYCLTCRTHGYQLLRHISGLDGCHRNQQTRGSDSTTTPEFLAAQQCYY